MVYKKIFFIALFIVSLACICSGLIFELLFPGTDRQLFGEDRSGVYGLLAIIGLIMGVFSAYQFLLLLPRKEN